MRPSNNWFSFDVRMVGIAGVLGEHVDCNTTTDSSQLLDTRTEEKRWFT